MKYTLLFLTLALVAAPAQDSVTTKTDGTTTKTEVVNGSQHTQYTTTCAPDGKSCTTQDTTLDRDLTGTHDYRKYIADRKQWCKGRGFKGRTCNKQWAAMVGPFHGSRYDSD